MHIKKKPAALLETIALGYLYLPIVVFMLSWIKLWISIPIALFIAFAVYKVLFDGNLPANNSGIKISRSMIFCSISCFVLILLVSYFLGIGGFTDQPFDSIKHNFILKDLIENSWPVHYEIDGNHGVLCYYLAGYMIPALVGKITSSFDAASVFSVFWHAAGVFIGILILYKTNQNQKNKPIILLCILLVVVLFAPFNALMQFLYMVIYPEQTVTAFHFQWISEEINVQFSSNMTLLRYVFPQFVPSMIIVALLFRMRKSYDKWALIVAPLISYSVFAFIGAVELMLVVFLLDIIKEKNAFQKLKQIISIENIAGFTSAVLFLLYLAGNIMQTKPASAEIGLKLVDYSKLPLVLLLHEFSWGLWLLFLFKTNKKEPLLWASSICLFIFPFFEFGHYNDLCIRGSIPALLCLCYLLIKQFLIIFEDKNKYTLASVALFIALILSGGFFILEEMHLPNNKKSILTPVYYWDEYENSMEFYTEYDWTKYQYINWEENKLSNFILQ